MKTDPSFVNWCNTHPTLIINICFYICIILIAFFVCFIVWYIITMIKNEKNAKKFRSKLKVGDVVRISTFKDGIVHKINDDGTYDVIVNVNSDYIYEK